MPNHDITVNNDVVQALISKFNLTYVIGGYKKFNIRLQLKIHFHNMILDNLL